MKTKLKKTCYFFEYKVCCFYTIAGLIWEEGGGRADVLLWIMQNVFRVWKMQSETHPLCFCISCSGSLASPKSHEIYNYRGSDAFPSPDCVGRGSPTVVFMAKLGLLDLHSNWWIADKWEERCTVESILRIKVFWNLCGKWASSADITKNVIFTTVKYWNNMNRYLNCITVKVNSAI